MIINNTPIEQYESNGLPYYVKREDRACTPPGPPFAKVRGLYPKLKELKESGIVTVGYMDTSISMAGWGISYFCQNLGMEAVIYYPNYKAGLQYNQEQQLAKWREFGATVVPLHKPNYHQINIRRAQKLFNDVYPTNSFWLPNGLKFKRTIIAVSMEAMVTMDKIKPNTLIMCMGSGVMLSGVLLGIANTAHKLHDIRGVLVHDQLNPMHKQKEVFNLAGIQESKAYLFRPPLLIEDLTDKFQIVKGTYDYTATCKAKAPFPCNTHYDLKAFEYMINNLETLEPPVLFWNIGA